ncbi:tubulin polyglutamylase [Phytophthora nicotianae]|uniref:Tubulin polyglutamylase n=1 Tax=Phytophthora nicotianae TaxID=4792 RepID=A0A0W8DI43_PHYNI|nr:tubulin polyglutamylase [Phytophthora nicotianae]
MLELKTLELAADAGISSESFSASYSWRRRFMRRHKLSVRARTRQGQTTPEDAVAARTKFRGEVRAAIVEHNIIQVFNADRTDWHGNKRAPFLVLKAGVSRHRHVQEENDSKRHGFGVRL